MYSLSAGSEFPDAAFEELIGHLPDGAPLHIRESRSVLNNLMLSNEIPTVLAADLWNDYLLELRKGRPRNNEVISESDWRARAKAKTLRNTQGQLGL